jgi:hypothetical protein
VAAASARGLPAKQLKKLQTGDFTSLRRLFAKMRVNKCYQDFATTI